MPLKVLLIIFHVIYFIYFLYIYAERRSRRSSITGAQAGLSFLGNDFKSLAMRLNRRLRLK